MLNQCKNCGGELQYDIASGLLKCLHCSSSFDPDTFVSATNAQEMPDTTADLDITLYTCPACGAQISSVQNAAVDYCMYCGSFVTLDQELSRIRRPDHIIPFSQTQEQCKNAYQKLIRRKIYAPKEFRDASFLEGFKGIYIPFWSYEYDYGPNIDLPGESSTRHGDYIYKQQYHISLHVDHAQKEASFDASSSFDDSISRNLVPYSYKKRRPFSPSYMFGFFGDTADVPESTYTQEADRIVRDAIWEDLENDPQVKKGYPTKPADNALVSKLHVKRRETLTMLPVWFLTWKKGDKIAYSIVNGDNGKVYAELPVSVIRYLLFSFLTAIPIFLLLNGMFTFNASNMLMISAALSGIMILLYAFVLQGIVSRRTHADDKGYLAVYHDTKDPDIPRNAVISYLQNLGFSFKKPKELGVTLVICAFIIYGCLAEIALIFLFFGILIFPAYSLWCIYRQAKQLGDPSALLSILGAYAAYLVSGVILYIDPAADMIYYITAIVCMIAIGVTAILIMRKYNDMITRPTPHFFDRKAGEQ